MPNPSQVCKDGDAALNEQSVVAEGLNRVRQNLLTTVGLLDCEDCGDPIPDARREALKSARTCVDCQECREEEH